jgi:hypothetical protein
LKKAQVLNELFLGLIEEFFEKGDVFDEAISQNLAPIGQAKEIR